VESSNAPPMAPTSLWFWARRDGQDRVESCAGAADISCTTRRDDEHAAKGPLWREHVAIGSRRHLGRPDIHPVSGGRLGPHRLFVAALLALPRSGPTLARPCARASWGWRPSARSRPPGAASASRWNIVFDGGLGGKAEAVAVICPFDLEGHERG